MTMCRVLLLILLSLQLANSLSKSQVDEVLAECLSPSTCTVKLNIQGTKYTYITEKLQQTVFAKDSSVRISNGKLENVHKYNLHERFVSKSGVATVSITLEGDKHTVHHGIFATEEHGVIDYSSTRNGNKFKYQELSKFRKLQNYFRNWRGSVSTNPISFINSESPDSCYPNDKIVHTGRISVAVDYGFVLDALQFLPQLSDPALRIQKILASVQNIAALAELIWVSQLNIRLEITHVEIGDETSLSPLNMTPGSCTIPDQIFSQFRHAWMKKNLHDADWGGTTMLVSSCLRGEVGGMADPGSFCWPSYSTAISSFLAKDFAHELGHTFGADHSFQNGIGTTGGIMDYGSGFYNGSLQFHPYNRVELCNFVKTAKIRVCKNLYVNEQQPGQCGDLILSPTEECECADGSTTCGACQNCRLVSNVHCSTTFAIRRPVDVGYVTVSPSMISSPECCSANGIVPVAKSCNGGRDMCGYGGFCFQVCAALGKVSCGISSNGCRQKCVVNGQCVEVSPELQSRGILYNAIFDGTPCHDSSVCTNGSCGNDMQATLTRKPSKSPTKGISSVPSAFPSFSPSPNPKTCSQIKAKGLCKSPCSWCQNKCMSKCKRGRS